MIKTKRRFVCKNRHYTIIEFKRLRDVVGETACDKCGEKARIVIESTPIHFHGDGFTRRSA